MGHWHVYLGRTDIEAITNLPPDLFLSPNNELYFQDVPTRAVRLCPPLHGSTALTERSKPKWQRLRRMVASADIDVTKTTCIPWVQRPLTTDLASVNVTAMFAGTGLEIDFRIDICIRADQALCVADDIFQISGYTPHAPQIRHGMGYGVTWPRRANRRAQCQTMSLSFVVNYNANRV